MHNFFAFSNYKQLPGTIFYGFWQKEIFFYLADFVTCLCKSKNLKTRPTSADLEFFFRLFLLAF
jgi:hypothetical protein